VTRILNVHEAKTHLSRLLQDVERGEEVLIARAGEPVARLVPVEKRTREIGFLDGLVAIADDFDDTPTGVIRGFER
jgi:prevent-host-death family protein